VTYSRDREYEGFLQQGSNGVMFVANERRGCNEAIWPRISNSSRGGYQFHSEKVFFGDANGEYGRLTPRL
jgi:hypothetical protein